MKPTVPISGLAVRLAGAAVVFGGGAGVSDPLALVHAAERVGAAVGGTPELCDDARLPRALLVGASGARLGARCYVAFGISGAPHHMAGVDRVGLVVSVNSDRWAPITDHADVIFTADADRVLACLVEPCGPAAARPCGACFTQRRPGAPVTRLERLLIGRRGRAHRVPTDDANEIAAAIVRLIRPRTP
jgi:hypothetical protein